MQRLLRSNVEYWLGSQPLYGGAYAVFTQLTSDLSNFSSASKVASTRLTNRDGKKCIDDKIGFAIGLKYDSLSAIFRRVLYYAIMITSHAGISALLNSFAPSSNWAFQNEINLRAEAYITKTVASPYVRISWIAPFLPSDPSPVEIETILTHKTVDECKNVTSNDQTGVPATVSFQQALINHVERNAIFTLVSIIAQATPFALIWLVPAFRRFVLSPEAKYAERCAEYVDMINNKEIAPECTRVLTEEEYKAHMQTIFENTAPTFGETIKKVVAIAKNELIIFTLKCVVSAAMRVRYNGKENCTAQRAALIESVVGRYGVGFLVAFTGGKLGVTA